MILSTSVEQQILASLAQGKDILEREVLDDIEPEYFQVESYQWYVKTLKAREWSVPDVKYLEQLLLQVKDEAKRAQFRLQLENLYYEALTFEDDAVVAFKSYLAFCVVNSTLVASGDGYKNSQRIDYWLKDLRDGINKAETIIQENTFKALDYASDAASRIDRRVQERDNPTFSPRILTGISEVDLQFIIRGPIIVNFLAPYKRYKSIFLNSLGFASLLQGFNALHVTLENDYELTTNRYDTMFSLLTYDRVVGAFLTQDELNKMRETFEWMNSWSNRLHIVKGRAKQTGRDQIIAEVERLKRSEGFVPDVIIIDYLNILASSGSAREMHLAQEQIVWDLKDIAELYGCPIITASQATREAAVADRVALDQQGKSVGISQAVDLTIAIDQTPQERAGGIVVLSPLVSRAGPITIPEIVLDSDLSRMLVSKALPDLWKYAAELNPYVT